MTPLFPPTSFVFDPVVMLAWGGLASVGPLLALLFMAVTKNKMGVVVSLALAAVTFAVGAVGIGLPDSHRVAAQQRHVVVSEWLDEYYPQYGGAALYEFVGTGKTFQATGPDGREHTMSFDFDESAGYKLVSDNQPYQEMVPPVSDIQTFDELVKSQEEAD